MIIDFFGKGGGQGGVTTGQVQTMINNSLTAYTETDDFATINGSAITEGGEITIQASDPNAEKVVELTQAQYNALTGYAENTTYVITDAAAVDMDDYATKDDLDLVSGLTNTALATKADRQNITAYTGASYHNSVPRLPVWNEQGVITGNDGVNWGAGFSQINGTYKLVMAKDASSFNIYAPTGAGTQNQMLVSNGSGAPVWTSQKIVFCTQTQYDALTPDATTLYIITGD